MNKFKVLWKVIRHLNFDRVIFGFLVMYAAASGIVMMVEPGIDSYGDALWYMFVACTSIGFGDIVATTFIGRLMTVIVTVMEILLVAMFSGVVVSFYLEIVKRTDKENISSFMDRLEHASELSKEELREIEDKVKEIRS